NIKIYIVEDSSVIRENLIDALHENAPIEVVGTAEDERTALTWLRDRSHACDLAIVDIFLKNGSGLGVLKGMGELPEAPVCVVLSNHATPRSAPSVSSSARSRCSTSRTSSTRCSAGSTATPKAIAELLRCVPEDAEVAADGDEPRPHREITARVGLDRSEDPARLARGLGDGEDLGDRRLHARMVGRAEMAERGGEVRRA